MRNFWRFVHILISLVFVFCSAFLTYAVISHYNGDLDNFAGFLILTEAIFFIGNGNKCPLRKFHKKYEKNEELIKVLIPGKTGEYLLKGFTAYTIVIFIIWGFYKFL